MRFACYKDDSIQRTDWREKSRVRGASKEATVVILVETMMALGDLEEGKEVGGVMRLSWFRL